MLVEAATANPAGTGSIGGEDLALKRTAGYIALGFSMPALRAVCRPSVGSCPGARRVRPAAPFGLGQSVPPTG